MGKLTSMTTKKPTSGNQDQSGEPGNAQSGKKRKSAGFIETSGFKPNWLETGPLSPDMLPENDPKESAKLTPDEYEALQNSLQRFYQEAAIDDDPPQPVMVEAIDTELIDDTPVEGDSPALPEVLTDLSAMSAPDTTPPSAEAIAAPAHEDWIAPLLEAEDNTGRAAATPPALAQPVTDWVDEPADVFIEDEPDIAAITAPPAAPATVPAKRQKVARSKTRKRRDRLSTALFIASLLFLAAAALVYFVNPFSRIALGSASLARPIASPSTAAPSTGSGEWCLTGEFLPGSEKPQLIDSGGGGDILAEDQVFSLEYVIAQPGTYEWQVFDCANGALIYPEAPAWVTTTQANQPVTFNFDSNERDDPLFFPIPYVVSAIDNTSDYRVLGNFQDWNPEDSSGQLQRINIGLYQQVRRIARSGEYEAYVIAGGEQNAIDAYGRTTTPIPFSFETDRNGDFVVFLVDTDRGRASVMYDMPPLLTSLAYGNGNWILSVSLAGLAGLILLGLVLRWLILNNKRLQMESGCPNCGRHELMRISRRSGDRALHWVGIPAYRYRCRHCTWEGTRLSERGATISAGVPLAYIDES